MEALLSLSFDNISSRDNNKIRKGLRQIEGLLAQICLSTDRNSKGNKARASSKAGKDGQSTSSLSQVAADPAFREFFRLQEGFEGNVASRLVGCLERLLGMPDLDNMNHAILSALDLLQGVLLLHPPSRTLFRQEIHMNVLLDLLDVEIPPNVQSQALLVLVSALLGNPENTRTFENLDGLMTVASLFKSRTTAQEVKLKAVEFFYFYLMPEAVPKSSVRSSEAVRLPAGKASDVTSSKVKTTKEKQQLLGRYMSNVAELVQDLQEASPLEIMA
ncbi:cell division control protein 14 [Myriangium duriaei CBS 260.36]|uniref:Cell division control protein 14 n=1 Tax=Myriangium duriaei CBS 260.36 TaxID=1168546 RepID=A0A9P4J217_9PEZI|nr:cell division control protein 14 [Myriangium duriaei CBS 260.36]